MSTRFDNFAVIEHDNLFRFTYSRKTVRNNYSRFILFLIDDIFEDFVFRNRINRSRWFI